MTEFARKGLLLDFGGVISVTLFERHALSEQVLGLRAGTLTWRGPFDPEGDRLWADMLADRIAERDYWARRASEVCPRRKATSLIVPLWAKIHRPLWKGWVFSSDEQPTVRWRMCAMRSSPRRSARS